MEEDKDLKPDGKFGIDDVYEASPEFQEEHLESSKEFFKKENPALYKLMKKHAVNKETD